MTITCTHCGKTAQYHNPTPGCLSLGNAGQATGFIPFIVDMERDTWFCPECFVELKTLTQRLVDFMGGETGITFRSILRR